MFLYEMAYDEDQNREVEQLMMEVCLCASGVGNEVSLLSISCLPVLPVDSAQLCSSPQTPTHMELQDGYLLTGSYGKMEGRWRKIVRRSSSSSV